MRPTRLANYLVGCGLQVRVLTCDPETFPNQGQIDTTLLNLLDPRVQIELVPLARPSGTWSRRLVLGGYTCEPDEISLRWRDNLHVSLGRNLESEPPDCVIVTMPPFSLFRTLAWLRRHTKAPIVADMRDAWSHWILTPYPSFLHYLVRLWQERQLLNNADLVLTTSLVTKAELHALHPGIQDAKILYAPNSFDEYTSDDFQQISQQKEILEILYLGSFYYNPESQAFFTKPWYQKKPYQWLQYSPRVEDWSYRSPQRLLSIVNRVLEDQELRKRVKFVFAGTPPEWWSSMISTDALRECCTHLGLLPKKAAMERLARSDALILTSSKVIAGRDYSIAGKTFEYFASRKPIVGFVTDGAQKDIIEQSGVGLCLDPDDLTGSATALTLFLRGRIRLEPNESFIGSHQTSVVAETILRSISRLT